jgi:hypothetical protein
MITYILPKSRTTQAVKGGRKIEKAWKSIESFLTSSTTAIPDRPTSIYLNAYKAYWDFESPELANEIIKRTILEFGESIGQRIGNHYPENTQIQQSQFKWNLTDSDLQKAIDYLIKGQPWPKFNIGPVELILSYDFKLVDPSTKLELSNQTKLSRLLVWLSRSSCCTPDLYFPFESPDNAFWNYLDKMDSYFAFKLERKYLRHGRLNKKGTNMVYSKIVTT